MQTLYYADRGLIIFFRVRRQGLNSSGGHFALTVDERHGRRACHNLTLLAESMKQAARAGAIVLSAHAGQQAPAASLDSAALAS